MTELVRASCAHAESHSAVHLSHIILDIQAVWALNDICRGFTAVQRFGA